MRIPLPKGKECGRWERWFAWHPVIVGDCIVWLETIERTLEGLPGFYEYFNYRTRQAEASK